MGANATNRLERFLGTGAGARYLAEAEAEAAAKEVAVQARRDLADERADLQRRRREVVPELRRRAAEAEAARAEARAALRAVERKCSDARNAAFNEDYGIGQGLRRVEIALRRTTDPRILAAIEEVGEIRRSWCDVSSTLYRFRSEKATNWDGTDSWVKRAGNNQAGIDALKRDIEDAEKALELLALVPEPSEEDIAEGIARARAAIAAAQGDPPPMVMTDYDSQGRPKAK